MIKDYKHLVGRKEPKMITETLGSIYALYGITGWAMCVYLLDKFC